MIARERLVPDRLAGCERGELIGGPRSGAIRADRAKGAGVAESEVFLVIVVLGQLDAFFGQDVAKRSVVHRFAVGDDAVEVEHNGAQHSFQF